MQDHANKEKGKKTDRVARLVREVCRGRKESVDRGEDDQWMKEGAVHTVPGQVAKQQRAGPLKLLKLRAVSKINADWSPPHLGGKFATLILSGKVYSARLTGGRAATGQQMT